MSTSWEGQGIGQFTVINDAGETVIDKTVIEGGAGSGGLTVTKIDDTDSPYTAQAGEFVLADTAGGSITVNLPTAEVGAVAVSKAAGPNTVTVQGESGENIDGEPNIQLAGEGDSGIFQWDGQNSVFRSRALAGWKYSQGDIEASNKAIIDMGAGISIWGTGGGSGLIRTTSAIGGIGIWDSNNGQLLFNAQEGGPVRVQNVRLKMDNDTFIEGNNAAGGGAVSMFKINSNDKIEAGADLFLGDNNKLEYFNGNWTAGDVFRWNPVGGSSANAGVQLEWLPSGGPSEALILFDRANDRIELGEGASITEVRSHEPLNLSGGDLQRNGTAVVGTQEAAIADLGSNLTATTTDGTLEAIGDTSAGDESPAIERNLTELEVKVEAILTALRNHGLIAT